MRWVLGFASVAAAVVVCSGALATAGGSLTGRIVFTGTDAPFANDVMLVRADGERIDLSKSRAYDTAPVVSPDGEHVAFFSLRGGHGAEYVVSTDGRELRQVSPAIADSPSVAWSPSGSQLAVLTAPGQGTGTIHLAGLSGRSWRLVAAVDQPNALIGWSPDGARIAFTNQLGGVEVVTAAGRKLVDLAGENGAWSPTGRLAVTRDSTTVDVYDASGRRVSTQSAASASWSPGDLLATLTPGGRLTVRRHGVGRPSVNVRVGDRGSVRWISSTVVWFGGSVGFDIGRHRTIKLPAGYSPVAAVLPSIGVAFGEASPRKLVRSRLGGSTRDVTSYAMCQGRNADAFSYLQPLPDGSGAVYVGDCASPSDVFEVRPDGKGLARVTHTQTDETTVTASPDGTHLAFTRTPEAECVGCDDRLTVTNAAGGAVVTIPLAAPTDGFRQDEYPSFSPDGSSIVFSRWNSSVGDSARLYRVAAAGGAATGLGIVGTSPAWGPSRLAFQGPSGVATVAPDGSGSRLLPGLDPADEGPVAWSRSGRLAILRTSPPMRIIIPSTGRRIPLAAFSMPIERGAGLAWSPDGSKLAFVAADADGVGDVWTVNADGTGLTHITHDLGAGGTLSWR